MAFKSTDTYKNYPPYQQAMHDLQVGKWQEGLAGLADVEKKYPLDTELRGLRQEMQVRSRIDDYEIEEIKADNRQRFQRVARRVILMVVVAALLFGVIATYSGWLQGQWTSAQQSLNTQLRQSELTVKLYNARQLLQSGQTDEAMQILEEIEQSEPAFPGLSETMKTAREQQEIETQYAQAMELLAAGNAPDALEILQMIDQTAPQYRDVSLQIKNLQALTDMDASLAQAEQDYAAGRWDDAIAGYEALRLLDPEYKTEQVEAQLFQAYINAASAVLNEPNPSLELLQAADHYFSQALSLKPQDREAVAARTAVRTTIEDRMVTNYIQQAQAALIENADSLAALAIAETWFARALELRPNDPTILVQYQLAQVFLKAVESFAARDYDAVIEGLETVVGLDENYAAGTARQTLFEAYIGRGQAEMSVGDYLFAIQDFQKAAALAQKTPNSLATYLEAQILLAEAQGLSGSYLESILTYQTALSESGLRETILASNTSLATDLLNADATAAQGNYARAFQLYRTLLHNRIVAYDTATTVTVKGGDYLTSLARQFGTTVSAILEANNLTSQDAIDANTILIIPTLP